MTKEEYKEMCKMYANFWISAANNGYAKNRNLFHGDKKQYTDQEKIDDAMTIANTHIHNYVEACDNYQELYYIKE